MGISKKKIKNVLTKNRYVKFFPIVIIPTIVGLVFAFNYLFNTFTPYLMIENNGFMLSNNELSSILNKEDLSKYDNTLNTVEVHEADNIYKMALDKYTNEEKKTVDISYPLFINDGLSIVNYNENINMIDNGLKRYMGSSNKVFSYGKVYELYNYEPIDDLNYILLNYSNGVYINLYDLKIKTNAYEYTIPVNSFVYFLNNRVNYFERDNNEFIKNQVIDIDYDSVLSFYYEGNEQEYSYRYEDFLIGLGKLYKEEEITPPPKEIIDEKDQIEEVEEDIVPTPTPIRKPKETKPAESDFVWIKPSVTSTSIESNVYSASGSITINDPAGVIVKAPSFTILYNEKVYARRSFNASCDFVLSGLRPESTFEIVGQYTYLDEDMKTKKIVTFLSQTITTDSMEGLDPIEVNFTLGDVYSRKIELKELAITSDIRSETLRGVHNVAIIVGENKYNLTSYNVNRLINGITLKNISTSESLISNRDYDFEIGFFDTVGNKLNVINGTGKTRTSKKMPSVVLKIAKNEIDYVLLNIDLKNDDHVDVSNYRYVITNTSGRVIQQDLVESNKIRIENLDPNQIFTVHVFANFDLNDGKGLQEDYELANVDFTSLPITSLGFLNLKFEVDNIDDKSIDLKYYINTQKTDERLIKLVKSVQIKVIDKTNDSIVKTINVSKLDLDYLKELHELDLSINGLDSNTKYSLSISTIVQQGETIYDLECLHNLNYLETHKKKPIIDIQSSFVTNDMIDFDVGILDVDGAILSTRVRVELRDNTNKLISSKLIGVNKDYERITYKYLKPNRTYYIIFIADEYNETNNNSTFKSRYELARVAKYTEDGISGKIQLNSAVKVATGENLADMNSETKWVQTTNYYTMPKTTDSDGYMHIYAKKGTAAYTYDLSEYHGEYVTVTFKIKAITQVAEKLYFCNYVSGTTSSSYGYNLKNISSSEWTTFTYSFVVGSYFSGKNFIPNRSKYYGRYYADFIGFYITNVSSLEGQPTAEYVIKDFEVYRSREKVSTRKEGYKLEKGAYNSNGSKNNSGTNNDYRIRTTDAVILEGNKIYEINFSTDLNYTAYIYFTDMNNKYVSAYGWFDSGRIVYVPENTKMYIMFRYYSSNMPLNPEDIHLEINQYKERDVYNHKIYTYDFVTTIKVNVQDLNDEIADDKYYIRVSDINGNEIYVNEYKELVSVDKIVDSIKNLDLEENRDYRVSLYIKVRSREYELDYFNISTDKETVGIANTNDWAFIQPYGNYIVLNDLDFNNYTLQSIGWGYRTFNGMIDFQGYSATIYTYTTNVLRIGKIERSGVVKNLVLNVHLNNDINNTNIRGFISSNYGTIENVMINVYDEREKYFDDLYISLLLESNSTYGVVRNFAINIRTRLNLYWDSGLLVRTNYGLIENGYVQGENAFVTNERSGASSRNVALIQKYGGIKSVVRNVYVLSSIEFPRNYSYDLTGLISYETYGTVENVYTTGTVSTINQAVGPIVGYVRASAVFKNAYYLNDSIYTTLNQNRISTTAISDLTFQKSVLKDGFNVDEMLELGYYPQVRYTYDKMPSQDYIELPKAEDKDLIDILNIDVASQTNNSALVDLTIQNEFGDEITNIGISNLQTSIVSQKYEDGKSYIRIEVSDPSVFVSKYEIRSITSKSYNNITSERKYAPGDKYLYVEMYREIHNINDWLTVNKFLNQNFAIMEDLDFLEYANYYINNYTGTMNGNNHTLRNINIISGKAGLFNQMNGTLKNIYFENVNKTSDSTYNGIAGSSNQYGKYYNVHVKNMSITIPSTRTSNTIYAGALVGYANYTKFNNCSVTNININSTPIISDIMIGGMVGYSSASTFDSIYVQNLNIEVRNAVSTIGVGGLLGRESSTIGTIANAYTTGKIYNNGRYSGGVVGYTVGYIENTYSMVDVITEANDIGGITGRADNASYIKNNLFIGNVSSKKIETTINRIIGDRATNETNYALSSGLINGLSSDKVNGESLLSKADLFIPASYNGDGLQLGTAFDYSKVSQGIMPKLFYMDTEELLPNQEDIYFQEGFLDVVDLVIDKHADYSNVVFYLNNPDHYIIDDVVIENMETAIIGNSYENGISIITLRATPIKFFDSYYAKAIKYHIEGSEEILTCDKQLFLEMIFFKNLRNYDDWQNISKSEAENYILVNDIDFTGLNFNRDVVFNRLETISDDEVHSLKGMHFTHKSSKADLNIIKKVMTSIKNIKFEDIDIQFTQASNNAYTNIICYMFGQMYNVTFENVTINAPFKDRVAMIGRDYTEVIDEVKLKDINLKGRNYVAGFLAYYENNVNYTMENVEAENITIVGSGNYVGGLFTNFSGGSGDTQNIHDISIKDSTITAINGKYVGGIGAYAGGSYFNIDNVHVIGKEYVGGAFGYMNGFTSYNISVKNSNIEGSYRYIGGIAGQIRNYMYYSEVADTTITGTSSDTYGVGGFFGYHNYYNASYNSVRNCTITNNGKYTGGFIGTLNYGTISANSIDNVIITGANDVGGLVGNFITGALTNDRVANVTINAEQKNAGGIVGLFNNSVSGTTFTEGYVRNTAVFATNVTSGNKAGGLYGDKNESLYYPQNTYGVYYHGNVTTNDGSTAYISVGNGIESDVIGAGHMGFYAYSKVNGTPIKNKVFNTVSPYNLITGTYQGFVNESTGVIEMNYNYPLATYTDLIRLTAGKTYVLKGKNAKVSQSDVFRVRLYDANEKYLASLGWNTNTYNYLGMYYSLGNLSEVYITPLRDVYIRVLYLYELAETSLNEIGSTYSNLLSDRLFTGGQLRNRILWNRYLSEDLQDFGAHSYFLYDKDVWDMTKLNNEVTNMNVPDNSGNNRTAKASFTSLTNLGIIVGGKRDEVKIDNFTPQSNITISTKFTSLSTRSYQFIFSYRDPSVSSGVGLFLHGTTLYAMINGSNYSSGYTIPLHKEVQVTMTYENNKTLKIYVNGSLVYSNLKVNKTIKTTNNAKTYIANDATYTNTYKFLAALRRVDVYSRALSEQEVRDNYNHAYGVTNNTGLMLSYDFGALEYEEVGYYPELKKVEVQDHVPLPSKSESVISTLNTTLSSPKRAFYNEPLDGIYHIYPSSIDTINLEFDRISNGLSFTYQKGDMEETVNVEKRVYTLNYDYSTDIVIKIRNAYEEKTINLTKDDLRRTISIYDSKYYYIKDNKLYEQNNLIIENVRHIYKNLVLLDNGSIYNLSTNEIQTPISSSNLIVGDKPLYQATVDGVMMSTYYNFTEVIDKDSNSNIRGNQIIYKNGYLYTVDASDKDMSSVIVNTYNGSEYQIALGFDKEVYSYKTSLNLNSSFINSNIKEIYSDFDNNLPIIMIMYDNGEVLVLNYYNGEKLYDNGQKQDISLIDYIGMNLKDNEISSNNNSYSENSELKDNLDTLTDKEITDILNSIKVNNNSTPSNTNTDTNTNTNTNSNTNIPIGQTDDNAIIKNNTVNNKYVVSYNEKKGEYEVYDVDDILFGDSQISINSKINNNKALYNYFYSGTTINEVLKDNRTIIYLAIISLIIANLIYFVMKYRRKEVGNE